MKTIITTAAALLVSFSASAFLSVESFNITGNFNEDKQEFPNIDGTLTTTQFPEFKADFDGVAKNLGDMNDRLLSGDFNLTVRLNK